MVSEILSIYLIGIVFMAAFGLGLTIGVAAIAFARALSVPYPPPYNRPPYGPENYAAGPTARRSVHE